MSMDYKLIMGNDHNQLSERVSKLIDDGYIVRGSPFVDQDDCYYQAVELADNYANQDISFALQDISKSLEYIVSLLDSRL